MSHRRFRGWEGLFIWFFPWEDEERVFLETHSWKRSRCHRARMTINQMHDRRRLDGPAFFVSSFVCLQQRCNSHDKQSHYAIACLNIWSCTGEVGWQRSAWWWANSWGGGCDDGSNGSGRCNGSGVVGGVGGVGRGDGCDDFRYCHGASVGGCRCEGCGGGDWLCAHACDKKGKQQCCETVELHCECGCCWKVLEYRFLNLLTRK